MLQAKHCSRTLLPPHIHPLSGVGVTQSGEEKRKNREVLRKTRKKNHESPQRLTKTTIRTTESSEDTQLQSYEKEKIAYASRCLIATLPSRNQQITTRIPKHSPLERKKRKLHRRKAKKERPEEGVPS